MNVASGINVQENQAELYVTDRSLFDATLQEAGVQLPDRVAVFTVYEPLSDDVPFAVTPAPSIHFPQLEMRSPAFMEALREGELVVKDGCLYVTGRDGRIGSLVIWQPDYFLNDNAGTIEVLDREGEVVARVGETIRLGGGEVPLRSFERYLREPLPSQCSGPYWLMGEVVAD